MRSATLGAHEKFIADFAGDTLARDYGFDPQYLNFAKTGEAQLFPALASERLEHLGGPRPLQRVAGVIGGDVLELDLCAAALAQELEPFQPRRLREEVLVLGELECQPLDRHLALRDVVEP